MSRMYENMKIQDFFPFDSAVVGLENLYSEVGENSFYVQSGCIISKDKLLSKGKHYLIFDIPTKTGITITEIILIDLFYYESSIHLIAEDINTHRVSIVSFCLECPEKHCTMFLVDINYFIDRMDAKVIKDYCGCSNKKKPIGEGKTKYNDDLLEFEF
jgi:hypothetical protein